VRVCAMYTYREEKESESVRDILCVARVEDEKRYTLCVDYI